MPSTSTNQPHQWDEFEETRWNDTWDTLQHFAPAVPAEQLVEVLNRFWDPDDPTWSLLSALRSADLRNHVSPIMVAAYELVTRLDVPAERLIKILVRHWDPQYPRLAIERTYQELGGAQK